MKNEIKLNKYQEELMKSNKNVIICDWDRATGKTWGIFNYINEKCINKPLKILYLNHSILIMFEEFKKFLMKNDLQKDIDYIKKSNIDGEFIYRNTSVIHFKNIKNINADYFRRMGYFDYIVLDDIIDVYCLFNIKDLITNKTKIIITLTSSDNSNVDILSYKNNLDNSENISINSFKETAINKLMKEFLSMDFTEKTSMTRERLLGMIKTIRELK